MGKKPDAVPEEGSAEPKEPKQQAPKQEEVKEPKQLEKPKEPEKTKQPEPKKEEPKKEEPPKKKSYYLRKKAGEVKPNPHSVPESSKKNLKSVKAKTSEPKQETKEEVKDVGTLQPSVPKLPGNAMFYIGIAVGIGAVVFGIYWLLGKKNKAKKPELPTQQDIVSQLSPEEIESMANKIAQEELSNMPQVQIPQTEPPLSDMEQDKLRRIQLAQKNFEE